MKKMDWYEKFRCVITNSLGRINPRCMTKRYFERTGNGHLWETFAESTKHLSQYDDIKKVKFLDAGIFDTIPKCYCGSDVTILNRKVSKFCSVDCMLTDVSRREHISKTKLTQDHNASNEKRSVTMIEKYGVAYNSQRSDIHHIWKKSKVSEVATRLLNDKIWLEDQYITKSRTLIDIAKDLDVCYGTVSSYLMKHDIPIRKRVNRSSIEIDLCNWLTSLGEVVDYGSYSIIPPYEIDCYLPERRLAIEINGLYWHSKKEKDYHLNKTELCLGKDISLLHVTDSEWLNKKNIVKSIILNKLGKNSKIYGRHCVCRVIDTKTSKIFLDTNHIQGHTSAKINIGLFHNEELVMVLSMGRPRFNKKYDWEVIRVASKIGHTVVGGLSKLIKKFRSDNSGSILTYVDRRFGEGAGYVSVGFERLSNSAPGYTWTDGIDVISRYSAQKKNLEKWLPTFDSSKSETQMMESANYRRMWDCGNCVMILR